MQGDANPHLKALRPWHVGVLGRFLPEIDEMLAKQPFLVGSDFSVADITFACVLREMRKERSAPRVSQRGGVPQTLRRAAGVRESPERVRRPPRHRAREREVKFSDRKTVLDSWARFELVRHMANLENRLNLAFAALTDPTRRAIVARLCSGDATVGELAEPFEIGLPTLLKAYPCA